MGVGRPQPCIHPLIPRAWKSADAVQSHPRRPRPAPRGCVFGKAEGELPPPFPHPQMGSTTSLAFSAELSRNEPRRSVTRERDDPSLNKLFSFPRIKGRKGRGVLDWD